MIGPGWSEAADRTADRWHHLDREGRAVLLEQAADLTRTRYWEGLDGLDVRPEMQAMIATQACVLTVGTGLSAFADVTSIVVAPTARTLTTRQSVGGSIVGEEEACVLGQASMHGPLRISWDRVQAESAIGSPTSVVIHEFAHKVDMADGMVDGTPPIRSYEAAGHFERSLSAVLELMRSGEDGGPLRAYAATNRAEFFAVATETFFLRPDDLKRHCRSLFEALSSYYRQDPSLST